MFSVKRIACLDVFGAHPRGSYKLSGWSTATSELDPVSLRPLWLAFPISMQRVSTFSSRAAKMFQLRHGVLNICDPIWEKQA